MGTSTAQRDPSQVLFLLAGSAASGKTTVLPYLASLPGLLTHDFDEGGVPADADTAWRQQRLEQWVQYAVQRQHEGKDVLLAGQSPLGELIACPSATQLDSVGAVLLDVDDRVRLQRLRQRDGARWSAAEEDAFLGWAVWHRQHAVDPRSRPEVLVTAGWAQMCWRRWRSWRAGDPRWRVDRIDTTDAPVADVAAQIRAAVRQVQQASGKWPLTGAALRRCE